MSNPNDKEENNLEDFALKSLKLKRRSNVKSKTTSHSCKVCSDQVVFNKLVSHVWYHLCVDQFACSKCQQTKGYGEKSLMEKHIEGCIDAKLIDRESQYRENIEFLGKMCFPDVDLNEVDKMVDIQSNVDKQSEKTDNELAILEEGIRRSAKNRPNIANPQPTPKALRGSTRAKKAPSRWPSVNESHREQTKLKRPTSAGMLRLELTKTEYDEDEKEPDEPDLIDQQIMEKPVVAPHIRTRHVYVSPTKRTSSISSVGSMDASFVLNNVISEVTSSAIPADVQVDEPEIKLQHVEKEEGNGNMKKNDCKKIRKVPKRSGPMRKLSASKDDKLCCQMCEKAVSRTNLTAHSWFHMDTRIFSCSNCGHSIRCWSEQTYLKKGHIPTVCPAAHVVDHRSENIVVYQQMRSFCFPTVPHRISLLPKDRSIGKHSKLCCGICDKLVPYDNITSHSWLHMDTGPFSCSECGRSFNYTQQTILRRKHIPINCPDAHVIDNRKEQHDEYQRIRSNCFPTIPQRYIPLEVRTEEEKIDTRNYNRRCLNAALTHLEKFRRTKRKSAKPTTNVPYQRKRRECNICDKQVEANKCGMVRHTWSHLDFKLFACSMCQHQFVQEAEIKRHKKNSPECHH